MDATRWRAVERVLDVALDSDPGTWPALLDEHCAHDAELRREVETLLARHSAARGFLESPPAAAAAALIAESRTAANAEGRRIGAWRLVRQIGQGGSSRVFLAERADGEFAQQVALKLLRPDHDSEIDQSHFRSERQILASLSHPHIARLLDGGVSDEGLPYFVMELVDGEPIDRYCEARGLSLRARLEMFLTVAEATQHAHRSLVVHRDLKPSNILVTKDGRPKLLDFGLAKLLGPEGPADATMRTMRRWMTPEYAAPEQVRGERVTTQTDVHQLGVVLYELLTGRLPFGTRDQGTFELERAILEREPPPPSSVNPLLRGDLDAIVLQALRKEPEQRYPSVQALADDVRRSLSGHPVLARRQTAAYRARRFARRHAFGLVVAASALLAVVAWAATVTVQRARVAEALARATDEAQRAQQVTDLMLGLFEASERGWMSGDTLSVRALLDRGLGRADELSARPVLSGQLLDVIGQIHLQIGDHERARTIFERALDVRRPALGEEHPDVASTTHSIAVAANRMGDHAAAIARGREALAIRRRRLGDADPLTLETLYWLANFLHDAGEVDAARPLHDEWIRAVLRGPPVVSLARATQLINLSQLLQYRGDHAAAEPLVLQALATRRALLDPRHPEVALALRRLGSLYFGAARFEDAERVLREAVALLREAYPEGHPDVALTMRSLGNALYRLKRLDEATSLYVDVDRFYRRFYGASHVFVAGVQSDLGKVYRDQRRFDLAEPRLREAHRIYRAGMGEQSLMTLGSGLSLGDLLRERGQLDEAEPLLLAGYEAFRTRGMPGYSREEGQRFALTSLVKLYEAQGREGDAARFRALLSP